MQGWQPSSFAHAILVLSLSNWALNFVCSPALFSKGAWKAGKIILYGYGAYVALHTIKNVFVLMRRNYILSKVCTCACPFLRALPFHLILPPLCVWYVFMRACVYVSTFSIAETSQDDRCPDMPCCTCGLLHLREFERNRASLNHFLSIAASQGHNLWNHLK